MQKRIWWDEWEKEALIQIAVDLAKSKPGMSMTALLAEAQRTAVHNGKLKQERMRKVIRLGSVKWFTTKVTECLREAQTPKIQTVKIEKNIGDFPMEEIVGEVMKRALGPVIETITTNAVSKIVSQVIPHIKSIVERRIAAQDNASKPNARPIKVLIAGLNGDQQSEVKQSYDGLFDLSFVGNSVDPGYRSKVVTTDHIVLMTKFIDHAIQTTAKNLAASKIKYVNGGMTDLDNLLDTLWKG